MHAHSIDQWQHDHAFLGAAHDRNERKTWFVVAITAAMMVAEIVGGSLYGSMALFADGWHMSTHAAALAIAAFAYRFARRHVHDPRFSFGTGKLGELAGFASAAFLALIALFIGYESIARLYAPVPIHFGEAIAIAVVGLCVNLVSAWLLRDDHHHGHHHHHHDDTHESHDDHHHGHDNNLRAAYVHVLADALTSILAILALVAALLYGWVWMDAAVGIIGACVIAAWAVSLLRSSAAVLLDMVPDGTLEARIRTRLEVDGDKVSDLHLWRVGPGHVAVIAAIVSDNPQDPSVYKGRLSGLAGLSHVTVEVHPCKEHPPRLVAA